MKSGNKFNRPGIDLDMTKSLGMTEGAYHDITSGATPCCRAIAPLAALAPNSISDVVLR